MVGKLDWLKQVCHPLDACQAADAAWKCEGFAWLFKSCQRAASLRSWGLVANALLSLSDLDWKFAVGVEIQLSLKFEIVSMLKPAQECKRRNLIVHYATTRVSNVGLSVKASDSPNVGSVATLLTWFWGRACPRLFLGRPKRCNFVGGRAGWLLLENIRFHKFNGSNLLARALK